MSNNHTDAQCTDCPPKLGRRERKKREVYRRIYKAAFDLFLQNGFDGTSVDEIAERADVGKGTVFNYFPRKTSFLAALADDWFNQLIDEMGPAEKWRGKTRGKLERLFLFLADLSVQNPELSRLALFESLRHLHSPLVEGRLTEEKSVRNFQAVTRLILRQGQKKREVRAEVELENAATLIEHSYFRTLIGWLRDGGTQEALRAEISSKLDIIFSGIAPRSSARKSSSTGARSRQRRKGT